MPLIIWNLIVLIGSLRRGQDERAVLADALNRQNRRGSRPTSETSGQPKSHLERRTFSDLTPDINCATVDVDDPFGDCQAKAHSWLASIRIVRAEQTVKQVWHVSAAMTLPFVMPERVGADAPDAGELARVKC